MKFQNSQNDENIEEGKKAIFGKAVMHDKPVYRSSSLSPDIEGLIFRYDNVELTDFS